MVTQDYRKFYNVFLKSFFTRVFHEVWSSPEIIELISVSASHYCLPGFGFDGGMAPPQTKLEASLWFFFVVNRIIVSNICASWLAVNFLLSVSLLCVR